MAETQTTSGGVVWGPIIRLSTDAQGSGGNYNPLLATQGDTIHCIWYMNGPYATRLPYRRSTDAGITWETTRALIIDSLQYPQPPEWCHFVVNSDIIYIVYSSPIPLGYAFLYFVQSSDRGGIWSEPFLTVGDTMGANFSASGYSNSLVDVYCPIVNDLAQYPRIASSTDGGLTWRRSAQEMPSSSSNQLRVALTPGLLNFIHPGNRWPGPAPEIVIHRSTDLADTWKDSIVISPIDGDGSDMPEVATYLDDDCGLNTMAVMWRGEDWDGAWFSAGMAVRISYDNGETWQPIQVVSDIPRGSFHDIVIRRNIVAVTWAHEETDLAGPFQIKTRISYDGGTNWEGITNLTPDPAAWAWVPTIALSDSTIHVAWEELIDGKWNIYYCRGELIKKHPELVFRSASIQFDSIEAGITAFDTITVENTGIDTLSVGAVLSDDYHFGVSPNTMMIAPGEEGYFTISFTPSDIGEFNGNITFISNAESSPDCIGAIGTSKTYHHSITYNKGGEWTLVSIPVKPDIAQTMCSLISYERSYVTQDSMIFGTGYWAKPESVVIFRGIAVMDSAEISIDAKWNIIGSLTVPVAITQITAVPPEMILSPFYGYDSGRYKMTDTLYPGRGYWVKSNRIGKLKLSTLEGVIKGSAKLNIIVNNEMPPPPPDEGIEKTIPIEISLMQNYPNPFNPVTKMKYSLPNTADVSIRIYDIFGREVATLIHEKKVAGIYEVSWNAAGYASSVYYARLYVSGDGGNVIKTIKLLLIK